MLAGADVGRVGPGPADGGGERRVRRPSQRGRHEDQRQRRLASARRREQADQRERVQNSGREQDRRRSDPVGEASRHRAERGAGERVDPAGQARRRVPAGGLLDEQQQGERRHADAESRHDANDQQDPAALHLPHAKVLAQCGHESHLQEKSCNERKTLRP
jgi:hypothetical protein